MLDFKTMKQIVVFDIDGVLFHTPSSETIEDPLYWHTYWSDIDAHIPNLAMLSLLRLIADSAWWNVVLLTARPEEYRLETLQVLTRHGIAAISTDVVRSSQRCPILVMWNGDHTFGNARWKREVLESWERSGAGISFVVEDHKPSADIIRGVAPVLLFERQKEKVEAYLRDDIHTDGGDT